MANKYESCVNVRTVGTVTSAQLFNFAQQGGRDTLTTPDRPMTLRHHAGQRVRVRGTEYDIVRTEGQDYWVTRDISDTGTNTIRMHYATLEAGTLILDANRGQKIA